MTWDVVYLPEAERDFADLNRTQQLLIRKHCTRSLSKKLGFTEATISQHLKILHEAGLVYKEKYGYHMTITKSVYLQVTVNDYSGREEV